MGVRFDIAFTSPLKRAKKTAQILLEGQEVKLIEDERIIEIGFGSYEGLCYAEENYNIPDPHFMNFFEKPEVYQPAADGRVLNSFVHVQHLFERIEQKRRI